MDENLKKVSFTEMKNGTKADYELLTKYEHEFVSGLPDRILQELKNLGESLDGYKVSRLEHSLQSATRALVADCNECSNRETLYPSNDSPKFFSSCKIRSGKPLTNSCSYLVNNS